jgi:hypothetical protein
MAFTLPASCGLNDTPLSTTATVTPSPSVSGHTLLQSSASWAHGTDVTFELTWPGPGQFWFGWGSVATGVGTAGGAGRDGCFGRLDDRFGDGLDEGFVVAATTGCRADRAAATAGTWAAAASTTPSTATAIRLIRAASEARQSF